MATILETRKIHPDSARWLGASIFGVTFGEISPSIAEALPDVLATLNDSKQILVLILRYGLYDRRGYRLTLRQVGDELHYTHEHIRQIEKKALRRLRHPIRSKFLRKYIKSDGSK